LSNQFVVVAERGCASLDVDDFSVFESEESQNSFRCGSVSEVSNRVCNSDFIVLKQDSAGFASDSAHACKGCDVALGHDGSSDMRVELAIIMDESVKLFLISGFKGLLVLGKDTHVRLVSADVHNFFSIEKCTSLRCGNL
jgi:hypothetical protein